MTRPEHPTEPMGRGSILHGFRASAHELWGDDGIAEIAKRLPPEVRAASIESIILPVTWQPVRYAMAWQVAVYEGPAGNVDAAFAKFIERSVALGFARVKRIVAGFMSPEQLLARAPALWNEQHTHGRLHVDSSSDRGAIVRLSGNPLTTTPLSRLAVASAYRAVAAMSRVRNVRESHKVDAAGAVVVELTWSRGGDGRDRA